MRMIDKNQPSEAIMYKGKRNIFREENDYFAS